MARVPRYKYPVGTHIGAGSFGTVDHTSQMTPEGQTVRSDLARKALLDKHRNDADAVARFKREVRMLGDMDHPNIVEVIARNLSADPPWFVMPLAQTDLGKELEAGRGNDRQWVNDTFATLLEAMDYAHKTGDGVVHRDLKPENVLVIDGELKVSDFGLGKRLDSNTVNVTQINTGLGTMAYMAPEQFDNAATVGVAADVYSLGKILGEMLTGKRPTPGAPHLDTFPEEYRSFIERCTQHDPADRYANAGDARAAFELLVTGDGAVGAVTGIELEDRLATWEGLPTDRDSNIVKLIANDLVARQDDEEFFYRAVPRLPQQLVTQMIERHPTEFNTILEAYNEHVSGALPFEYCDVLANFYRHIYRTTPDLAVKRLVLERLVDLGPRHNRFYVGRVVAGILRGITDGEEAKMAAEILDADHFDARWLSSYVLVENVAGPIAAVLLPLKE